MIITINCTVINNAVYVCASIYGYSLWIFNDQLAVYDWQLIPDELTHYFWLLVTATEYAQIVSIVVIGVLIDDCLMVEPALYGFGPPSAFSLLNVDPSQLIDDLLIVVDAPIYNIVLVQVEAGCVGFTRLNGRSSKL